LAARCAEQLNAHKLEVETAHGVSAHVFSLDLTAEVGAADLHAQIKAAGLSVDILINNAGFGRQGEFVERSLEVDLGMIDLNVKALVADDMIEQGSGKILHGDSTAGLMLGPLQATYFATKAFVKSFSQALDEALRGKGVTSTVLAPGFVETEFAKAADLEDTGLVNGDGATAESVAQHGYDAMMAGKLVTINQFGLRFMINCLMPFMPYRMKLKMISKMQTKA
jgi:short-subunit dehydrogenase